MKSIQTLDAVCTQIVDCEHKTAPKVANGQYFAVGTPAMAGNRIDFGKARRISKETFASWTRRMAPRHGDLLLAREAPVGPVVQIPETENVAPGQRTVLLRPDPAAVDSTFLYYFLSSPEQQKLLQVNAAGSTVPHLNVADVRTFAVRLPDLTKQRATAETLSALDDKIAANVKLADLSDQLVRASYGEVAATAIDTKPVGALAWSPRQLIDPADVADDTPYIGLDHMRRRHMWLNEVSRSGTVSSAKTCFECGDILFGRLRPYFHKVVAAPVSGLCSTDILVCRPKSPELAGFVLAAISSDHVVERCTSASEGTRMPRSSWNDLQTVEVSWPGEPAASALSARVITLQAATEAALSECATIAALRDTLLPQLISGKLRVRDAEKQVEEVT